MIKKKSLVVLAVIASMSMLAGCGNEAGDSNTNTTVVSQRDVSSSTSQSGSANTTSVSTADVLEVKLTDEDKDSSYDASNAVKISLNSSNTKIEGDGATFANSKVTITKPGTYILSGELNEGQIYVNSEDKGSVRLIFNGVNLSNTTTAPVYIEEAKKVIVTLVSGTNNTITDSKRASTELEDLTAAFYSKADTVINGEGKLIVNAGFKDGITSKDDLKIVSGDISITSNDDGMVGKDLLQITGGTLTINASGDGLKSTNDTDANKGNILIDGGTINLNSANDGIQAEKILQIDNGTFNIKTGAGSENASKARSDMGMKGGRGFSFNAPQSTQNTVEANYKGLKGNSIIIGGGNISIDSQDDAIHSNSDLIIASGNISIMAGDDGIHAENKLTISGGLVNVKTSYEGIEGNVIEISGGEVYAYATDDGFNASAGQTTPLINITGGYVEVTTPAGDTDAVDSNGNYKQSGGFVLIKGGNSQGNMAGSLDADGSVTITGGTTIALGGICELPSNSCNAYSMNGVVFNAGNYEVKDSDGNVIASFKLDNAYSSGWICSDKLVSGKSYTVNNGNNSIASWTQENGTMGANGAGGMGGNKGGMQPGVDGGNVDRGNKGNKTQMPNGNNQFPGF